ncbi:MAG: DUF6728 family protein [Bacteroidota bacterium]
MQEVTGSTPVFSTTIFTPIMSVLNQLAEYLYLRKKDPSRPKSAWIGYMHGINRISLFIFLLCLVILAIKLIF